MSESTEANEAEAVVEEPVAQADAPDTTETQAEVAPEVEAEAAVEEPVAEAADDAPATEDEPVAEAPEAEAASDEPVEAVEEAPVPAEVVSDQIADVRQARVFLCERGHRVTALWKTPTVCQGRVTRSGPVCGRPLYPLGELPEQVQKALNPLKASKKSSKKK